jgi:hypothetical protein
MIEGPDPTKAQATMSDDAKAAENQFEVRVGDNYHYMDETENYTLASYPTLEAAIAVCKQRVDADLDDLLKPGTSTRTPRSAAELYSQYTSFGEDPYILGPGITGMTDLPFSAWDYAKQRCAELFRETPEDPFAGG